MELVANILNAVFEFFTGIDVRLTIGILILVGIFAVGAISMIGTDPATTQQIANSTTTQVVNQGTSLIVDAVYGMVFAAIISAIAGVVISITKIFS